jgi:hypothetical protein
MPRPSDIQQIIEQAVSDVLEAALPGLREQIVARATEAVASLAPSGPSPTELLSGAATAIQEANSQAEILRQLLEGGARFAARVALFVVKGATINGWQAVGFENNELIRTANLAAGRGLVADAVNGRVPAFGSPSEFDANLIGSLKYPAEDKCLVLPLLVKDKVAALIYADGGAVPDAMFNASALSVLTRFAAFWLEISAMRKAGPAAVDEPGPVAAAPVPTMATAAAFAPAAASVAITAAPGTDDADLHKKAKRFAKLLVEEIMLYNKAKVAEGKQNQDLYSRLREDIEKSRATYDKRYGESPAASADYFNQELVRILADNNVTLMGNGFPR